MSSRKLKLCRPMAMGASPKRPDYDREKLNARNVDQSGRQQSGSRPDHAQTSTTRRARLRWTRLRSAATRSTEPLLPLMRCSPYSCTISDVTGVIRKRAALLQSLVSNYALQT